ncbi:hypothetical protein QE152_g38666 [Popillia japonica]|uniref:PH domain-containing protein n=1 Tax=Popillia japonica TaxID=7064 RepID=A0AAW1HWX8_POPJA
MSDIYRKGETLISKFGDPPVEYFRLALETTEEIQLFEEALRRFTFSVKCDDGEAIENEPLPPKIKCIVKPPGEEQVVKRKPNKLKLLEKQIIDTSTIISFFIIKNK